MNAKEELEKIVTSKEFLENNTWRNISQSMFLEVGKKLFENSEELYLTSHTPGIESCNNRFTSYRLWTKKPQVSLSGHPDWNPETAVVEMWKNRYLNHESQDRIFESDDELVTNILQHYALENEVVRNNGHFCKETRIYKLK